MVHVSTQHSDKLFLQLSQQKFSPHYTAPNHDHLGRQQQRDVETQLGQVKRNQTPHFGIVWNLLKSSEVDLQSLCDGFVGSHPFEAALLLMKGTHAPEMLELIFGALHP